MSWVGVELVPSEVNLCAQVGVMRQVENIAEGRKQNWNKPIDKDFQDHINGATGEYVLAKVLNIHWTGKGELRAPDVGPFEVRTTPFHSGHLILHKTDADDKKFFLVTGRNASFRVHGWCFGRDGKQDRFWCDLVKNGRPAFFVPQSMLRPIDEAISVVV